MAHWRLITAALLPALVAWVIVESTFPWLFRRENAAGHVEVAIAYSCLYVQCDYGSEFFQQPGQSTVERWSSYGGCDLTSPGEGRFQVQLRFELLWVLVASLLPLMMIWRPWRTRRSWIAGFPIIVHEGKAGAAAPGVGLAAIGPEEPACVSRDRRHRGPG